MTDDDVRRTARFPFAHLQLMTNDPLERRATARREKFFSLFTLRYSKENSFRRNLIAQNFFSFFE